MRYPIPVYGLTLAWSVVAQAGFTQVPAADTGMSHVQSAAVLGQGAQAMTGGAAAGDFDNDGLVDLFFTRIDGPDLMYKNMGDGTFTDVSTSAGFTANLPTNGPVFGDIDNDGDLDIYVSAVVPLSTPGNRYYLYINDGNGSFTEQAVTRNADITTPYPTSGMSIALGDYDRDGYLDALTSDWGVLASQSTSRLLRNQGVGNPGHFQDVTASAGIDTHPETVSYRFSPRFADMDNDGQTDITFASDYVTSQLYWNNGDGTFTDGTAAAGVGIDRAGMGSAIGDYDGDGDLDWYVTAILNGSPSPSTTFGNKLYRNDGGRVFSEVTYDAGVLKTGWWWGTTWLDYDNDGDQDLMATNGMPGIFDADPTTLWRNNGDGTFADVTTAEGITDTAQGRGLLTLDYDNDGDLDTVVINHAGEPVFYRNDSGNGNAYLRVKTIGTVSNRDGIGARVVIDPDTSINGDEQTRVIDGGSNFLSQNEMVAHFGLGAFSGSIDLLTIYWPSGIVQQFEGITANQVLEVVEDYLPGDLNGDGFVGIEDINTVLSRWNQDVVPGIHGSGDPSGDGYVGIEDLNEVLSNWNAGTPPQAPLGIPEPAGLLLLGVMYLVGLTDRNAVSY